MRSTSSSTSSRPSIWLALALAMAIFIGYLTLRSRASFNIIRAAYPNSEFEFRKIWGAYCAGYGFNSVIPARGGDVVRLFLDEERGARSRATRRSRPAFAVEIVFDLMMGVLILTFAFTQGVFPKPPDFSKLPRLRPGLLRRAIRASRSS